MVLWLCLILILSAFTLLFPPMIHRFNVENVQLCLFVSGPANFSCQCSVCPACLHLIICSDNTSVEFGVKLELVGYGRMATFVVWISSASFPGGKEVAAASLQFFWTRFEVFLLARELVY